MQAQAILYQNSRPVLLFDADCLLSWQSFTSEAGSHLVFAVELDSLDSKGPHKLVRPIGPGRLRALGQAWYCGSGHTRPMGCE